MLELPQSVDLDRDVKIDPAWALKVPAATAMRRLALPLCALEGVVVVACVDPSDAQTRETIERACGLPVRTVRATQEQLRRHLLRVYGDVRSGGTGRGAVGASDDAVALTDNLIRAAVLRQASDIHIDPERSGLRVRMRVDGALEEFMRLPMAIQPALSSRIKVMGGLDIAERRAPQDGAFIWQAPGSGGQAPFDVRLATLPTRFGEKITLRLLEAGQERLDVTHLGLSEQNLGRLRQILDKPNGLVLMTGPTGSGKTTTLYAAIRHLLTKSNLNILTVEDPVEYEIAGVSQVEVEASDKVNFSKALRSLLRHDPDVVMIGEIRDGESLGTAIKAALTGHLVLSTLHTNDAVSAVARLMDMGCEPHLIAATLRLSAAQRLVRKLCPVCREAHELDEAAAAALSRPELVGQSAFRPRGCLACAGRGFNGRTGIFEFLVPDDTMTAMIARGAPVVELEAKLRGDGVLSLRDDAIGNLLSGATTLEEVLEL